jgi:iron complex transport system permease protein
MKPARVADPSPQQWNYTSHRGVQRSRARLVLAALAVLLIAFFLLSMIVGSVWVPVGRVVSIFLGDQTPGAESIIVMDVRLPQALTALLAGAALGIAGLQMQTLFRNPLADPFALGIASGASLGVALVLLASGSAAYGVLSSSLGLFGDAMVTLASIVGAAGRTQSGSESFDARGKPRDGFDSRIDDRLCRVGIRDGPGCRRRPREAATMDCLGLWIFLGCDLEKVVHFRPANCFGTGDRRSDNKQLDALLLGENYARSLGLSVERTRMVTMAGASILGGVVTAFCGPIAFLGVAIPHLCRAILGTSDHRVLVRRPC